MMGSEEVMVHFLKITMESPHFMGAILYNVKHVNSHWYTYCFRTNPNQATECDASLS